jgi:hypothetical protein
MGEGSEWIEASSGGSENDRLGSCEAHYVDFTPQEDRGGTAGTVGEGGEEESGIGPREPCCEDAAGFPA